MHRCLVLLGAMTFVSFAEAPQTHDTEGRRTLEHASAAMLGNHPLPRLWMVEGAGRENLTAELQGTSAQAPTWRPHEERVGVDTETWTVGWERRTPRNDDSLRHRRFVYAPDSTIVIDHANAFGRRTAGNVPLERRRELLRRIPHLLVHDLLHDDAIAIERPRARMVDGESGDEVTVRLAGGESLSLTIGREPAVLLSAAYDQYFPGRGNTTIEWRWTGWRPDERVGYVPAGHTILIGGDVFQEVTYARFSLDADDTTAFLTPALPPPSHSQQAEAWARAAGPATGTVAPGVHIARVGGFTVLFAELEDGILVFEAPEPFFGTESIPASNRAAPGTLAPQLAAQVASRFPGKAIRYIVVSHHHGDHLGGLARLMQPGTTALVPAEDVWAARRALESAGMPGADSVKGVSDVERIVDGGREFQVLNTGENPHTAGNLVLWIPSDGILIQGDLFYFDAGFGFHEGRDRMNRYFANWLAGKAIRPRLVYGVHNSGAAGPAAIEAALADR